jgi:hypothetical protein
MDDVEYCLEPTRENCEVGYLISRLSEGEYADLGLLYVLADKLIEGETETQFLTIARQ